MVRRAQDSLGLIQKMAIGLDSACFPYLSKLSPKNVSRAVRLCIDGHAAVANILRDPTTSDADKLADLYRLMPHALEAREKRRARMAENEVYPHG